MCSFSLFFFVLFCFVFTDILEFKKLAVLAGFYVNLTHTRVLRKEGDSVEKMPTIRSGWRKPIGHFLK